MIKPNLYFSSVTLIKCSKVTVPENLCEHIYKKYTRGTDTTFLFFGQILIGFNISHSQYQQCHLNPI